MGIALIVLALLTVLLILGAGIVTLWRGGQVSRDWSNRLMRYRVIAQFVAIVIIMAVFYFTSKH